MSFKENLRDELLYQDIKIKELSDKIGIPYSTILSYVCSKSSLPKVDVAYKIAEALGVTVEFLMTGKQSDNYKKSLSLTCRELISLPPDIVSSVQIIIHRYYELYKNNQMR